MTRLRPARSAATLAGTVNVTPAAGFGIGSYNLITPPTGTWTGAPAITGLTTSTSPSVLSYTLGSTTSGVTLGVSRSSTPGNFLFVSSPGYWVKNFNDPANWTVGGVGYAGVYPGLVATDTVTFDLTATPNPTVFLAGHPVIQSLTILNSGTLTFGFGWALQVTNPVTVGTGQTLTATPDDGTTQQFIAPINLSGGTLGGAFTQWWGSGVMHLSGVVTSTGASTLMGLTFDSGYVNQTSGTLTIPQTVTGSSQWQIAGTLNGAGTVNAPIALNGGEIGATGSGNTLTVGGAITSIGGTIDNLTLNNTLTHNSGTLTVNGMLAGTGSAAINGGTMTVNGSASITGGLAVNSSGTLNGGGTVSSPVTLSSGGTLSGSLTYTGGISATGGTLTGTPTVNCLLHPYAGTFTLNGTVGGSGYLQVDSYTSTPTVLTGSGTLNTDLLVMNSSVAANSTFNVNLNGAATSTGWNGLSVAGNATTGLVAVFDGTHTVTDNVSAGVVVLGFDSPSSAVIQGNNTFNFTANSVNSAFDVQGIVRGTQTINNAPGVSVELGTFGDTSGGTMTVSISSQGAPVFGLPTPMAPGFYLNACGFGYCTGYSLYGTGSVVGTGTITGNVYNWGGTFGGSYVIHGNVQVEDYWSGQLVLPDPYLSGGTATLTSLLNQNNAAVLAGGQTIYGDVTVGNGGTLSGTSTINGNLTTTFGGPTVNANQAVPVIAPGSGSGSNHTVGTLTVTGALTLDSHTALNFNLGSNTTPGTTYDQITVGGSVAFGGSTVNLYNLSGFAGGDYHLMTYSSYTGSVVLGNVPSSGLGYQLTPTANYLDLLVYGSYIWSGNGSGNSWGTSGNWSPAGVPGGTSADTATFDFSQASSPTVSGDASTTIAALSLVHNGTLTLNATNNSVLTVTSAVTVGSGQALAGNGTLNAALNVSGGTMSGSYGGLTVGGALAMTSGVINGGTLNSTATISGGTVDNGVFNGAIALSGSGDLSNGTYNGSVTAVGGEIDGGTFGPATRLVVNGDVSNDALTLYGQIAPASTTINAGGILGGTSSSQITGPVAVNGGTLGGLVHIVGNVSFAGGTITGSPVVAGTAAVNSSTLALGGPFVPTGGITVANGATITGTGSAGDLHLNSGTIATGTFNVTTYHYNLGFVMEGNASFGGTTTSTSTRRAASRCWAGRSAAARRSRTARAPTATTSAGTWRSTTPRSLALVPRSYLTASTRFTARWTCTTAAWAIRSRWTAAHRSTAARSTSTAGR